MELRELDGRGVDHPYGGDRSGCERESVPMWFANSLERNDMEARGYEFERPYSLAKLDGAVADAMTVELAKIAEAERQKSLEDARARAKGAKDAESLNRAQGRNRRWKDEIAARRMGTQ